jgi:catechol O-methyltransferase
MGTIHRRLSGSQNALSTNTEHHAHDLPHRKMTKFDSSKAYAPQEDGTDFFDDGREIGLLHFIYSHKNLDSIRGSPKDVIAVIDEYGRKKKYLMNVGEDKGRIVTDLIAEVKPKIMVC